MKNFRKMDKTLLFLVIIYSIFGLVMIFSASSASTVLRYNYSSSHFFIRQLIVLVIGYILGIIILKVPTKYYKLLVYFLTCAITFLLFVVLVKGKITNNAQSWFKIGVFTLQPSEFAKSIIILFMAFFYSTLHKKTRVLAFYFIPAAIALLMLILIAAEPDWGSALIFGGIFALTFLDVPFVKKHKRKVVTIGLVGAIFVALILLFSGKQLLTSEKLSRLTEYKNPCERYADDSGYQVCNGFIAIASGGLFGVGLGKSSQKYLYLPESHTDFIFPIICEECGVIVGTIVIIGYGIMLFKILKISKEADNVRNRTICYGTFWYLTFHVLINLMGILAIIPLTGVPLPFLSYGGSFTLNAIIMIFLCERVAIENKTNKMNKEIKNL